MQQIISVAYFKNLLLTYDLYLCLVNALLMHRTSLFCSHPCSTLIASSLHLFTVSAKMKMVYNLFCSCTSRVSRPGGRPRAGDPK